MTNEWVSVIAVVVPVLITVITGHVRLRGRIIRLETQMDTIWHVYVEDSLRDAMKRGRLKRTSPYIFSDETLRDIIRQSTPEMMERAKAVLAASCENLSDSELRNWIIEKIGMKLLQIRSEQLDMKLGEYLSWWFVAVRQAEREGYEKFMSRVQRLHDEVKATD